LASDSNGGIALTAAQQRQTTAISPALSFFHGLQAFSRGATAELLEPFEVLSGLLRCAGQRHQRHGGL
tara:strand:- start:2316 stop:2519 length:204 start_codon:yes stop_codon:yes gene_type:complete